MMRLTSVVLAVCCCLSTVSGQRLERPVYLPDSLGGLSGPSIMAFDSRDHVVYVTGTNPVLVVIDCATETRIARIPLRAPAQSLCYDSARNELYCSHKDG